MATIEQPRPGTRHVLATAKGTGFLAGGSVFELASRFVISLLLARALGATGYGLYNLAISAGAIFAGIAALGLDDAVVRYVAIQVRAHDERGVRGTLQVALGVSLGVSLVLGAAFYVLAEPIAVDIFDEPALTELLRLFSIIAPAMTISNVLAAMARGFKRMDHVALAENVVMSLTRMVLIAGLLLIGLDVRDAAIVFGLSDIAASVALIALTNRHFPLLGLFRPGARREVKELFSFALPLWLSGLLLQFRKNIRIMLLGAMSAVANVGLISIVGRINLASHIIYRSIVAAVKPVLAELWSHGEREELEVVYRTSTRWTYMFNVPVFLVMALYPTPLLAIFGSSFTAGAAALVVLAFAELANAVTGTSGSILDMTGHTRVKLANSIGWIFLLLATNLALIPRWGVLGAAVATLVSTTIINTARVIEVWVLERVQPYDRSFLKPTAAGLIAAACGIAPDVLGLGPDTFLEVVAAAVVLTTIYAAVYWILGVEPEDRHVVARAIHKVRTRIARRA